MQRVTNIGVGTVVTAYMYRDGSIRAEQLRITSQSGEALKGVLADGSCTEEYCLNVDQVVGVQIPVAYYQYTIDSTMYVNGLKIGVLPQLQGYTESTGQLNVKDLMETLCKRMYEFVVAGFYPEDGESQSGVRATLTINEALVKEVEKRIVLPNSANVVTFLGQRFTRHSFGHSRASVPEDYTVACDLHIARESAFNIIDSFSFI